MFSLMLPAYRTGPPRCAFRYARCAWTSPASTPWTPAELRSYLAFLLWHYRVVDSFWFLYMAEDYGQPAAEQLNERVWARVSGLAARDLVSRFKITEKGLEGFSQSLAPLSLDLAARVPDRGIARRDRPHRAVLRHPGGPPQAGTARVRVQGDAPPGVRGHSRAGGPRIQVHCDFAPPGERPAGFDCRWRFTVDPSAVEAEQLSGAGGAS